MLALMEEGWAEGGRQGPMPDLRLNSGPNLKGGLRFCAESLAWQRGQLLSRAIWGTGQRGGEDCEGQFNKV